MSNVEFLADRYGELKAQIEELEKMLKPIKTELAQSGYEKIVGERYTITVGLRTQKEIDEAKIIENFNMTLSAYKKLTDACKVEKDPAVTVNYEPTAH